MDVDDAKISEVAKILIRDKKNPLAVSIASFWEIAIKVKLHKLKLKVGFLELYQQAQANKIEILDIKISDIYLVSELPLHHGDPFDRIIIAQAITERLTLITRDPIVAKYSVSSMYA